MSIKLEVVPGSYERTSRGEFYKGKIFLGNDMEFFCIKLGYWNLDDYKKQWREGIERLKEHRDSCLVVSVSGCRKRPFLVWYTLHRVDEEVLVYPFMYISEWYKKLVGRKRFTPTTCYKYVSEPVYSGIGDRWILPLDEVLRSVSTHQAPY